MANGDSPVPHMPSDVFDEMQSRSYYDGGYYQTSQSDVKYLRLVSDGDGCVEFELTEEASWPSTSARLRVSPTDNTTLQDCTLGEDGYTFTDSEDKDYHVHSNDGTPGCYVVEI